VRAVRRAWLAPGFLLPAAPQAGQGHDGRHGHENHVIETTKIIAVRTRFFERLPVTLACVRPPPNVLTLPGTSARPGRHPR